METLIPRSLLVILSWDASRSLDSEHPKDMNVWSSHTVHTKAGGTLGVF